MVLGVDPPYPGRLIDTSLTPAETAASWAHLPITRVSGVPG
jgi:hypothetical protein